MKIKILSPLWGHEHLKIEDFLNKIKDAGYDGVDTWIPENKEDKKFLLEYLGKHGLVLVAHQHQANGKTFADFKTSFIHYLNICFEANPLLINSHTGKDYFTLYQNLELIDIAKSLSEKNGIPVVHETHRGRIGYSPFVLKDYFDLRKDFEITADFSHWTCVTESLLENFTDILSEAIFRTRHTHARVGYEQGPQIPDPEAPAWKYSVDKFLGWWDQIVKAHMALKRNVVTFTTEFGPPPYLHTLPFTNRPVADQFEINCYMKNLLRKRYQNVEDNGKRTIEPI
jgi:hypothetical protein